MDNSPYSGYTSSLAFDSTGKPRIAYVDYDSSLNIYRIKYAEWTGTAWNIFPVIDNAGEASLSLALDQSGQPHISYWRNDYPPTGGLIYASWGATPGYCRQWKKIWTRAATTPWRSTARISRTSSILTMERRGALCELERSRLDHRERIWQRQPGNG